MKLLNLVIDVARLPVAVVKDLVTMGGLLIDEDESQTSKTLKDIDKDVFANNRGGR